MSAEKVRTAPFGGWPVECIESERRFGVRIARLYPLIYRRPEDTGDGHERNRGAVKVRGRQATLLHALAGQAFVEFTAERETIMNRGRDTGEPVGRWIAMEEVEPA